MTTSSAAQISSRVLNKWSLTASLMGGSLSIDARCNLNKEKKVINSK